MKFYLKMKFYFNCLKFVLSHFFLSRIQNFFKFIMPENLILKYMFIAEKK